MPWFWQGGLNKSKASASDGRGNSSQSGDTRPTAISSTFLNPENLLATAALTTLILSLRYLYTSRLRRIPNTSSLAPTYLLSTPSRSLFGAVSSVGDGDNFRIYHTPGGLLLGWHWLRNVPTARKDLKDQTLHVRIAGIDAPEMAHFGRPSQKHGPAALEWLRRTLEGQRVRVYTLRRDQYERVVGTAFLRRSVWGMTSRLMNMAMPWSYDKTQGPVFRRDVGLEMIRAGWATVYEAQYGAVFGKEGMEAVYVDAEKKAKLEGRGMWGGSTSNLLRPSNALKAFWARLPWTRKDVFKPDSTLESPRQYKTRMAKLDAEAEAKTKAVKR